MSVCLFQNDNDVMESEFEVCNITRQGQRVDPSHFELLKVLGQGSFGKVSKKFIFYFIFYFGCL